MARRANLESWLERLRGEPDRERLAEALESAPSVAAARAARIVRDAPVAGLEPELTSAFARFFVEPLRRDPGCLARTAIAEALVRLEHDDPEPFLRGVRWVQLEPVFGGRADTAVDLRGACAFGLAGVRGDEAFDAIVELLADTEPPARISAARALTGCGRREALTVLRLRALLPEPEPRVLIETLLALLRLDATAGLGVARRLLEGADRERAQASAAALGESRLPQAFAPLRDSLARVADPAARRERLLAIAALRREETFDFLLESVRDGTPAAAVEALEALATLRGDRALASRVRTALAGRDEERVRRAYARLFARS